MGNNKWPTPKQQKPNRKLGVYVDYSVPSICPLCRHNVILAEYIGEGRRYIKTDLGTCEHCKKAFTTLAFFTLHQDRLYSLNPEKTQRMIEQKNAQKAAKKAKEAAIKKAKEEAAKKAKQERKEAEKKEVQRLKPEFFDLISRQMPQINVFDNESLKNEWMHLNIGLSDYNSLFAAYIIKNSQGQYACVFVSNQDKSIESRIRASENISVCSWNSGIGQILLYCGFHNIDSFTLSGYENKIIEKLIIKEPAYKKRLQKSGIHADNSRKEAAKKVVNSNGKTIHRMSRNTVKRVYVYFRLTNSCVKNKHEIETVTAKTTNVKNDRPIEVNVFHCKQCKRYFINYEALQRYISRGVYPALQYSFEHVDDGMLKDASELMMYGYNVREGNLTQFERRRILEWIIDYGLLTKAEIIRDLQFKVRYNGNKAGNERARQKWLDDIQFVSQYTRGNSKVITATFIYKDS